MNEQGPFDDALFAAIARHHGLTGGGVEWANAGQRGIGGGDVPGMTAAMPAFRYAVADTSGPVLAVFGEAWTLSLAASARRVTVAETLPDTLVTALHGKRLSALIDIPGADEESIESAVIENGAGVPMITVTLR